MQEISISNSAFIISDKPDITNIKALFASRIARDSISKQDIKTVVMAGRGAILSIISAVEAISFLIAQYDGNSDQKITNSIVASCAFINELTNLAIEANEQIEVLEHCASNGVE